MSEPVCVLWVRVCGVCVCARACCVLVCAGNEFCRTMAGNAVELLLIGSEKSNKPAIILSGRVHPGESNASLMMHGMIDYILGPSSYASELRKNFTFYVVPMLNPGTVNVTAVDDYTRNM